MFFIFHFFFFHFFVRRADREEVEGGCWASREEEDTEGSPVAGMTDDRSMVPIMISKVFPAWSL